MLDTSEYNESYFGHGTLKHVAGYSKYQKWFNNGSNNFAQMAGDILNRYAVGNKSVLVLCSAFGFLVEELRNLGVDAYGVDVSQYAYDMADESVKPFLTVADIRTHLSTYRNNEFQLIICANSLCCFTDAEVSAMVTQINRISRDQFFLIYETVNPTHYNPKTITEWKDGFAWEQGAVFANIKGEFVVK